MDIKERNARRVLIATAEKDSIWDAEEMKNETRDAFYKVLGAWERKDTSVIKNYTTPAFYSFLTAQVGKRGNKTHFISFEIKETRIISCQDNLNNGKDKFVAYIGGTFTYKDEDKKFADILHFIRSDRVWLLDKINHGFGLWNLIFNNSVEEA